MRLSVSKWGFFWVYERPRDWEIMKRFWNNMVWVDLPVAGYWKMDYVNSGENLLSR